MEPKIVFVLSLPRFGSVRFWPIADALSTLNPYVAATRLPPQRDVPSIHRHNFIQCFIHRQFPQHHHLRNPQRSFAVACVQEGGEVAEHFGG